jgi:hypothetical protein
VEREDNEDMPQAALSVEEALSTPPTPSPFTRKGIDHTKTVKLREHGLSCSQIAAIQGCDKSNIVRVLQSYGVGKKEVEDYKEHRANILAGVQVKLLKHLTEAKVKDMPGGSLVLAVAQLYDKERLETGQSTSHVVMTHELKLDRSRYTDRMLVDAIDITPEVSK